MESVEKYSGEASQFASSKALGTNVGKHVFGNGVSDAKTPSENLMSNVVPSDAKVAGGPKFLGVLGDLESSRGIHILYSGDGTYAEEL